MLLLVFLFEHAHTFEIVLHQDIDWDTRLVGDPAVCREGLV